MLRAIAYMALAALFLAAPAMAAEHGAVAEKETAPMDVSTEASPEMEAEMKEDEPDPSGMSEAGEETEAVAATIGDDGIQRVEITGGDYFFKPERIILKKGVPAELVVTKEGGFVPHNILMNEPQAGMVFDVEMKKTAKTISFTPTMAGEFPFQCDKKLLFFKSHRERGMEGVIVVVD